MAASLQEVIQDQVDQSDEDRHGSTSTEQQVKADVEKELEKHRADRIAKQGLSSDNKLTARRR